MLDQILNARWKRRTAVVATSTAIGALIMDVLAVNYGMNTIFCVALIWGQGAAVGGLTAGWVGQK